MKRPRSPNTASARRPRARASSPSPWPEVAREGRQARHDRDPGRAPQHTSPCARSASARSSPTCASACAAIRTRRSTPACSTSSSSAASRRPRREARAGGCSGARTSRTSSNLKAAAPEVELSFAEGFFDLGGLIIDFPDEHRRAGPHLRHRGWTTWPAISPRRPA